jgi:hypothetical protein
VEARLADGAGLAHRATDIVGTMGAGGNTRAAVCFGAPASPQEPPLMVIISVVSCRVQEYRCVCSWPCPEPHARQRGDRAVPNLPPRLRRECALDSEDRPRFLRLAMDEPRP